MWKQFEDGSTIGTKGSENGLITKDEEHELGARVTIERDGDVAPWSIICGEYGSFMHTSFSSTENEANEKYERIKKELSDLLKEEDENMRYEKMDTISQID